MGSTVILGYALQAVLAIGILASAFYYVASVFAARAFSRRKLTNGHAGDAQSLPPVSVLKPLKGLEVDLYDNLATFCRQDYPRFEVVFGVADPHDPAIEVVHKLERDFPALTIRLVVDPRIYGANYKISNLHNMVQIAEHDVFVLADSDIRVTPDYIRRLVAQLKDPAVGVVTCVYRAVNTGGIPTLVESLFINADFAPSICVARYVETTAYAFGATIAVRRSVLHEIGGFLRLVDYLADDFYLGYHAVERGYRIVIADLIVETVLAVGTWRRLFDHQLRWARTYRSVRPVSYFGLGVTHGSMWAILNVVVNLGAPWSVAAAIALFAIRVATAHQIANRYFHAPMSWLEALCVIPKDLFAGAIWFFAFLGNTVRWSGHEFRITRNGKMVRVDAPTIPVPPYDEPTPESGSRASL